MISEQIAVKLLKAVKTAMMALPKGCGDAPGCGCLPCRLKALLSEAAQNQQLGEFCLYQISRFETFMGFPKMKAAHDDLVLALMSAPDAEIAKSTVDSLTEDCVVCPKASEIKAAVAEAVARRDGPVAHLPSCGACGGSGLVENVVGAGYGRCGCFARRKNRQEVAI